MRMLWPEPPNHNKWHLHRHLSYWAHTQIPERSEHPQRPWHSCMLPQCISATATCGKVARWCHSIVLKGVFEHFTWHILHKQNILCNWRLSPSSVPENKQSANAAASWWQRPAAIELFTSEFWHSVPSGFAPLYISERSVVTSALDLNRAFGILLAPVILIWLASS